MSTNRTPKDGIPQGPVEFGCSAVVTITLEVRSKGHWGSGATIDEVMRIGGRETMTAIDNMIRDSGLHIKRIGEPAVGAVTWAREKT